MGKAKVDAYKYADEAELLQSITDSGYILNDGEPLERNNIITDTDTGEQLDMNYHGVIVTNYPDTGEPWEAIYSTDVYLLCARQGNIKLPSNKKLGGNDRKYYYDYINIYLGEISP